LRGSEYDPLFCVIRRKEMFFVYIIYSNSSDRYYTGYCSNIENRQEKHNLGATPSTRPYRPWKLVYLEEYESKREAILREKEIKKQKSRKYIESLIAQNG
jgi:putative endonuclease